MAHARLVFLLVFLVPGCAGALRWAGLGQRPLVLAAGIDRRGFDPTLRRNGGSEGSSLLFSRLVDRGPDGKLVGDLAESWESTPDGLNWKFRLREGVCWHDGIPLTPRDVIFTFERIFDPAVETDLDLDFPSLERVGSMGLQVAFILKAPDRDLPLALAAVPILPEHVFREGQGDPDALEKRPVGTGPYRLVAVRENGDLDFEAHERFHLGKPRIARIRVRQILDDGARAEAVARGEADFAHVKPQHLPLFRKARGVRILRASTGIYRALPLNLRRPALQDARVRKAIDLALDREAIVARALDGVGLVAFLPLAPASWAYPADLGQARAPDLPRAEALLNEAGWAREGDRRVKDGQPLRLRLVIWKDETFRRIAGECIRESLGALGIEVECVLVDNRGYNELAENLGTEYDGYVGGWSGLEPGDNLFRKFHSKGSQNRIAYADPETDRLLERARETADRGEAARLYGQVIARVGEAAVFLPLAYPDYLFAMRKGLAGVEQEVVDSWYEFPRFAWRWSWGRG